MKYCNLIGPLQMAYFTYTCTPVNVKAPPTFLHVTQILVEKGLKYVRLANFCMRVCVCMWLVSPRSNYIPGATAAYVV